MPGAAASSPATMPSAAALIRNCALSPSWIICWQSTTSAEWVHCGYAIQNGPWHRTVPEGRRATPPLIELERIYRASRAVERGQETAEDLRYLQGKGYVAWWHASQMHHRG